MIDAAEDQAGKEWAELRTELKGLLEEKQPPPSPEKQAELDRPAVETERWLGLMEELKGLRGDDRGLLNEIKGLRKNLNYLIGLLATILVLVSAALVHWW